LAAAAAILQEEGYGAVKIERIAARAGTGKGTIYRWWPNKAAILMELYEREGNLIFEQTAGADAIYRLESMIRGFWKLWRETATGSAFRSIIAEAQGDPDSMDQLRNQFLPQRRLWAVELLTGAQQQGEIRADINIETLVDLLLGFSWYHLLTNQLADESVIPAMICVVLEGARQRS
jgi:AcrR family transcriptional regulator